MKPQPEPEKEKDPNRVRNITTVYLGRYTWEHANAIAGDLERAGIVWWYKQPGFFSQIWEFGGIRLFVDRDRLAEAREIADRIAPEGTAGRRPPPESA
jgi:hypothetical protein